MNPFVIPSEMFDDGIRTKNFWLANEVDVVMVSYNYITSKFPNIIPYIEQADAEGKTFLNVRLYTLGEYEELTWD